MMRPVVLVLAVSWGCGTPISTNNTPDARGVNDGRIVPHDAPAKHDGMMMTGSGSGSAYTCRNQDTNAADLGNGHHNAGMDCMDSCHDHGFTLAGTLYTDASGTTPVSGATITAIDSFGYSYDVISQSDGNFDSAFAMEFPITIYVSSCPNIQMMTAQVTEAQAGCNASGCHASGGAQGRVHLP
jgi:hypothetical protein